jgi:hypothetical protein
MILESNQLSQYRPGGMTGSMIYQTKQLEVGNGERYQQRWRIYWERRDPIAR